MKKLKISMLALAALALGACTSDDIALNDSAGKAVEIGGDGYVSFAINLPTTPVTRAANDVYDDGLESEYKVNDATLLLFAGSSESAATYYAKYTLDEGKWNPYESTTDNITSQAKFTQLIDTPASGNIYALVVLNNNGLLTDTGNNPTLVSGTTTLSSLQSTALTLNSVSAMTSNGFFMCNAPLISTPGGVNHTPTQNSVTTLAVIDAENIYSSAAEAEAHTATEIYVERGMAKVTVVDNTPTTPAEGQIAATINGFVLDITNTKSYLVRNTTGAEDWWGYANSASGDHRMAGSVEVADGLYRTYWATDPNYSADTDPDDMTLLEGTTPELTACADAQGNYNPLYCLENTFNVRHQNDDETTRVIIGATLNGGDDFYIWDNDKSTLYTTTTDTSVEPAVTTTGLDKIKALIMTQLEAEGYMEEAEALWVGPTDEEVESEPTLSKDMYDYITIVFDDEEDGIAAGDDLTFSYTVSDEVVASWFKVAEGETEAAIPGALDMESDEYAAVVADLNDHHQVAYYKGGESYYPVKIKHFGDELTPWSADYAGTTGTANEKSYPADGGLASGGTALGADQEEAWLGRYGVLRNNWYEITVTGVSQIGSATVPHAYGDPDDPTEQWISIEINILSWAKRTQSVTL